MTFCILYITHGVALCRPATDRVNTVVATVFGRHRHILIDTVYYFC